MPINWEAFITGSAGGAVFGALTGGIVKPLGEWFTGWRQYRRQLKLDEREDDRVKAAEQRESDRVLSEKREPIIAQLRSNHTILTRYQIGLESASTYLDRSKYVEYLFLVLRYQGMLLVKENKEFYRQFLNISEISKGFNYPHDFDKWLTGHPSLVISLDQAVIDSKHLRVPTPDEYIKPTL